MEKALTELLNIKKNAIWIKTMHEKETIVSVINTLIKNDIESIYTWSILKTIEKVKIEDYSYKKESMDEQIMSPVAFLEFYEKLQQRDSRKNSAIIFRDYEDSINNNMYKRMIKEITEERHEMYIPIIFIGSGTEIPEDILSIVSVIESKAPSKDEILELLSSYEEKRNKTIENKEEIVPFLHGFYYQQIIEILDSSFYKYDKLDLTELKNKRIEMINKTDLLSYENPKVSMEEIGGNDRFKDWYSEIKYCFNKDSQKYGVDPPKGYLALGIAGCSKTLMAKAIANDLNFPFLSLDMSKLLSCRVGESEQKISRAIELIESCAPCVLLIDEVEKSIGGYASSNASDSGVIARIFGKILEMLNDNDKGIFVVMTSNNVQDLPPELTRAGRLDGIWYFGLPSEEERKEILDIHFKKRGYKLNDDILSKAANETKNYTGAELEQIVKTCIKKQYIKMIKENKDKMNITIDSIRKSTEDVVPIYKSSRGKIISLEQWAEGRTLFANKKEKYNAQEETLDKIRSVEDLI